MPGAPSLQLSPRNPLSCAFYSAFNLVMRLTRSSFRGFAHSPDVMLVVLEDHGLRRTYRHRSRIWQVAAWCAFRKAR